MSLSHKDTGNKNTPVEKTSNSGENTYIKNTDNSDEQNELFEHFRFIVDKGQNQLRIDKYLIAKIEHISRNRIQNSARAGNILVNGLVIKPNYKVKPLDLISIVLAFPPRDTEVYPENLPISIVHEDDHIIVVNKAAGMVVHPGHGNFSGTLQNALLYYLQQNKPVEQDAKPYLVHRIDKDTSGIILIAKNELAQAKIAKQFFDHTIDRTYIALVWGNIDHDEGTIDANIGRDIRNRLVQAVSDDPEKGRHAVTHYHVLERFGYVTLVECRLETGRTHQIRVHFRHIGHPLFNDQSYGGSEILKGTTFTKYKQFVQNCFKILPRQALHAKSLGFIHPATRQFIHFESDYPEDLKTVIEKWRHYSSHKNLDDSVIPEI
jgi:23S rRNA pseudouridine1911/1915/1917 synthase